MIPILYHVTNVSVSSTAIGVVSATVQTSLPAPSDVSVLL